MNIVFYGTPDFAVASLKKLIDHGFQVSLVVTAPDKAVGRGLNIQYSAVKQFAIDHHLPIAQPVNLKSDEFYSTLQSVNPDLQVVIAFRMLPERVWNFPKMGTLNLHASLLPKYRGAAPIHWALINGETHTGITTFMLKHEIDTGNILLQKEVQIEDEDNLGTLYTKLMNEGAHLLIDTLHQIENNLIQEKSQNWNEHLPTAPKILPIHCIIDWNNTSENILNLIRGLSPHPGAYTILNGKKFKILSAKISNEISDLQILSNQKTFLKFKTKNGYIEALKIQMEGKKVMMIDEFLRGNTIIF